MTIKKILFLRFSSIGDIVLTTPVIRCVKQQLKDAEVHYVTKEVFRDILTNNPYVDKLHTFKEDISELYDLLLSEKYDVVIDLHRNLRTLRLKKKLKTRSYSFNKLNVGKYIAVNFKYTGLLPNKHIVDRYFETTGPLGISNDGKGLDYFINDDDKINTDQAFFNGVRTRFMALVVGGSYFTKKIPLNKLQEICTAAKMPVILLGDKKDQAVAALVKQSHPSVINACGQFTINQSASVVGQAEWIVTPDTGLMHIAAALGIKIVSAWGNTIPEFGMSPYNPNSHNILLEVKDLSCRPCSKLGFEKCPLGHFKCMNEIDYSFIGDLE